MALERIARWPFAQRGGARVDRRWYELRAAAAGHAPTGRPVIRRPGKRSALLRSLYAADLASLCSTERLSGRFDRVLVGVLWPRAAHYIGYPAARSPGKLLVLASKCDALLLLYLLGQ